MTVELVSTKGCGLCEEADLLLKVLQQEFRFDLRHSLLTEDHPRFREWHIAVPVVIIDGRHEIQGRITEEGLRSAFNDILG